MSWCDTDTASRRARGTRRESTGKLEGARGRCNTTLRLNAVRPGVVLYCAHLRYTSSRRDQQSLVVGRVTVPWRYATVTAGRWGEMKGKIRNALRVVGHISKRHFDFFSILAGAPGHRTRAVRYMYGVCACHATRRVRKPTRISREAMYISRSYTLGFRLCELHVIFFVCGGSRFVAVFGASLRSCCSWPDQSVTLMSVLPPSGIFFCHPLRVIHPPGSEQLRRHGSTISQ